MLEGVRRLSFGRVFRFIGADVIDIWSFFETSLLCWHPDLAWFGAQMSMYPQVISSYRTNHVEASSSQSGSQLRGHDFKPQNLGSNWRIV
jgi:hypothetical protein